MCIRDSINAEYGIFLRTKERTTKKAMDEPEQQTALDALLNITRQRSKSIEEERLRNPGQRRESVVDDLIKNQATDFFSELEKSIEKSPSKEDPIELREPKKKEKESVAKRASRILSGFTLKKKDDDKLDKGSKKKKEDIKKEGKTRVDSGSEREEKPKIDTSKFDLKSQSTDSFLQKKENNTDKKQQKKEPEEDKHGQNDKNEAKQKEQNDKNDIQHKEQNEKNELKQKELEQKELNNKNDIKQKEDEPTPIVEPEDQVNKTKQIPEIESTISTSHETESIPLQTVVLMSKLEVNNESDKEEREPKLKPVSLESATESEKEDRRLAKYISEADSESSPKYSHKLYKDRKSVKKDKKPKEKRLAPVQSTDSMLPPHPEIKTIEQKIKKEKKIKRVTSTDSEKIEDKKEEHIHVPVVRELQTRPSIDSSDVDGIKETSKPTGSQAEQNMNTLDDKSDRMKRSGESTLDESPSGDLQDTSEAKTNLLQNVPFMIQFEIDPTLKSSFEEKLRTNGESLPDVLIAFVKQYISSK
eukprot:TRINITY_DN5842_c0_g1_i1.p1 TRINITY_DN5842_c0_g1~~TRINITY_DN5842_c0_g1_i1.p1  ORF type:complete len:530 (-),score=146.70 TRINITY_DN5842_c0_g1_i1:194-1783(-)